MTYKDRSVPIEARFIIAFKYCSTKPLSGVISKIFKCFLITWKTFTIKAYFIQWTVENYSRINETKNY